LKTRLPIANFQISVVRIFMEGEDATTTQGMHRPRFVFSEVAPHARVRGAGGKAGGPAPAT
jgi:hypothetical protein